MSLDAFGIIAKRFPEEYGRTPSESDPLISILWAAFLYA